MSQRGRIAGLLAAAVLLVAPVAAAGPRQAAQLSTPGIRLVLQLPPAADNAPVISLGAAVDPVSGKKVEGLAFIHYKRAYHHRPGHSGGPGGGEPVSSCYSFLARGARWRAVEPWVLNGVNTEGLTGDYVLANLGGDIAKWEDAGDGMLGNATSVQMLGDGALTEDVLVADTAAPDGQNEVYWADVSSSGAIAVTIVWGVFAGPPSQRELVEWDQVYDDVDFDWSDTGAAGQMDFENVATHELGHSVGLGHPEDACTEETMYRFADTGETKKRSLEAGDVAGADSLY